MLTRQSNIILIKNILFMTTLLKLQNVNLKYQNDKKNLKVLNNINLTVKKKETISIVGESGSGKTSLIMLIGGLEKATSGKIYFNNKDLTNLSEDKISEIRRKNIGIVFQSFYLIPNYSALENVALTLELNKFSNPNSQAKELLYRFGLKNRLNNLPSQLSGGEQQRVAIARAIAMKPELILADEPTGNLDSENSLMISKILFKYVAEEGSSLIMVTHDHKLANKSKRKIKIIDGKIGAPLKGATLIGDGPSSLKEVLMVGNDMMLDPGIGTCGKAGQGVPVGVGQPSLLIDNMTVGGTQL